MNFKYALYLLPILVGSEKIIKNFNFPACKNCIHYQPNPIYNEYTSLSNVCNNFGEKNIINDEIKYEYANSCRSDESKCGKEGKYFVEEPNLKMKILNYNIKNKLSIGIIPIIVFLIYRLGV